MPKFNISVSHSLSQDEAMKRIKKGVAELKTRFGDKISDLQETWNENACEFNLSIKRFSGSGTMIVKPSEVEITGNLPLAAFFFKDTIETAIKERLKQMLA